MCCLFEYCIITSETLDLAITASTYVLTVFMFKMMIEWNINSILQLAIHFYQSSTH